MSSKHKSGRKILRAKRHEGSSLGSDVSLSTVLDNNEEMVPQRGIKRTSDRQFDGPSRKKANTSHRLQPCTSTNSPMIKNYANERLSSYRLLPSTSHSSPMTKNLANNRLTKLRRSLEEFRKQEDRKRNSQSKAEVLDCNVATSSPQIDRPRRLPFIFANVGSPIQSRKHEERRNCQEEVLDSNSTASTPLIARHLSFISANAASPIQNRLQICNNVSNLTELMDWGPIDEETVLTNINEIRKEISYENKMPLDEMFIPDQEVEVHAVINGIFVVVDTNIFLSKLDFLANLRSSKFSDLGQISIIVPWMVIQELDYMKDNSGHKNLGKNSRKAIHYINNQLLKKDMYFKGQSVLDASKQTVCSNNPDDGILHCCMQLVEQQKYVILLSNDTNLRNKALVHNVNASHSDNLLDDLKQLKAAINPGFNRKSIQKVKILLSNLLTNIIEKEMMNSYGAVWLKMVKTPPPYTPEEGLHLMQKYWRAVFSLSLQKQAFLGIETFISFLTLHNKDEHYTVEAFNKLIENSLSLCIYLKNGYMNHRSLVIDCIKCIQICVE